MFFTRRSVMKAAALGAACSAVRPLTSLAAELSGNDDKQFNGLRVASARTRCAHSRSPKRCSTPSDSVYGTCH